MNEKITQLLLVEDNQVDQWLTQTALEECGYQGHLHVVDEGNEALNFLLKLGPHQAAPTPDIILLDLHMPIMNGIEFLARIKGDTQFKTIPVVVITTSEHKSDREITQQYGIEAYLTKPFYGEQLLPLLNTLFSKSEKKESLSPKAYLLRYDE